MKSTPGKIYGPAGLVAVSGIFILMLLVGGIAIGFTRNNISRVSDRIGELDRQNREIAERTRVDQDRKAMCLSPLKLRNSRDMNGLVDATEDRIVKLSRIVSRERPAERRVSTDPRFTALDIAFIDAAPARGTAVR